MVHIKCMKWSCISFPVIAIRSSTHLGSVRVVYYCAGQCTGTQGVPASGSSHPERQYFIQRIYSLIRKKKKRGRLGKWG